MDRIDQLCAEAASRGIPLQFCDKQTLSSALADAAHQGIAAIADSLPAWDMEQLLGDSPTSGFSLILVLDNITDPVNFGAILRTAEAAGVTGVILPDRRSAPLSPAAIKAASGAAEHIPIVRVTNIKRALDDLRAAGYWCYGLAAEATATIYSNNFSAKTALVLGSEGQGLRHSVRNYLDDILSIPLVGRVSSLNVSNAAAVAIFEVIRQVRLKSSGAMHFPVDTRQPPP